MSVADLLRVECIDNDVATNLHARERAIRVDDNVVLVTLNEIVFDQDIASFAHHPNAGSLESAVAAVVGVGVKMQPNDGDMVYRVGILLRDGDSAVAAGEDLRPRTGAVCRDDAHLTGATAGHNPIGEALVESIAALQQHPIGHFVTNERPGLGQRFDRLCEGAGVAVIPPAAADVDHPAIGRSAKVGPAVGPHAYREQPAGFERINQFLYHLPFLPFQSDRGAPQSPPEDTTRRTSQRVVGRLDVNPHSLTTSQRFFRHPLRDAGIAIALEINRPPARQSRCRRKTERSVVNYSRSISSEYANKNHLILSVGG